MIRLSFCGNFAFDKENREGKKRGKCGTKNDKTLSLFTALVEY